MAKRYTGLNLAQTQPEDTIDFTGLGKGILAAEEFKYKEREKKKDQALELLKPQTTFHPYQAAADETLKGIYDGLLSKKDVDPLEVSRAAIEYNQQISLAKAVGESISGITQQYYQDPELNADVAAQMLKSKYIKDGSLPELYKISNQTLDGSFFLEEQGGSAALKVPLTLSNRLKTIGEITKKITTSGDWRKIPGLTGLAESEVLTRMTQAANIVDVDTNGNIYIKDISSPHADTAIGAMLTDQRVSRIVDDALALAGIQQPTYDQRKEELRRQLAPYASYTSTDEQKKATTGYTVFPPQKSYGPSGPGADYVANFQANILSGNTARIKDAVNYIRVAPDFNINSLPDQLATISLRDASGAPILQDASNKSVVLEKISGSLVEVIDAKAEQGDPKLGLDPNQLYVKITIKGPPPFLEKFNWAQENIDFHLPIEAFKDQTFTNFLYDAAKSGQGKDYGVLPSTVNVNQVYAPPGGFPQMALGGEIDVDTKYSDFKGTATVKDLIGGFSMGGYVSTSVRDLMKKGFNEGGTLPEYSAQAEEVTVTAEAPAWLKFKRDFLKENPFNISKYVEERVNQPQTGRAAYQAIDEQELRSKIRDQGKRQYEGKMYDYIQKKLVEVNPQAGRPRGEWLDSFSEKEQKILKQSPRFQPTYITDFKRSLQTAIEQNPTDAFRFIMDSKDYTTQEKKDMILSHIENPTIAKLADAAGIFAPLSMGSKVIQSAYRDDTTIESALMGIKNDASIIEDLITDVTTFIGPGTAAKIKNLMRIGKTKEAAKVIAQVADKLPAEAVEFIDDFAVKSQSAPMQPPVQAAPIEQVAATEEVAKVVDEAKPVQKEVIEDFALEENLPFADEATLLRIDKENSKALETLNKKSEIPIRDINDEQNLFIEAYEGDLNDMGNHDANSLLMSAIDFASNSLRRAMDPYEGINIDDAFRYIRAAKASIFNLSKNSTLVDPSMKLAFDNSIKYAKKKINKIEELAQQATDPEVIKKTMTGSRIDPPLVDDAISKAMMSESNDSQKVLGNKKAIPVKEVRDQYNLFGEADDIDINNTEGQNANDLLIFAIDFASSALDRISDRYTPISFDDALRYIRAAKDTISSLSKNVTLVDASMKADFEDSIKYAKSKIDKIEELAKKALNE